MVLDTANQWNSYQVDDMLEHLCDCVADHEEIDIYQACSFYRWLSQQEDPIKFYYYDEDNGEENTISAEPDEIQKKYNNVRVRAIFCAIIQTLALAGIAYEAIIESNESKKWCEFVWNTNEWSTILFTRIVATVVAFYLAFVGEDLASKIDITGFYPMMIMWQNKSRHDLLAKSNPTSSIKTQLIDNNKHNDDCGICTHQICCGFCELQLNWFHLRDTSTFYVLNKWISIRWLMFGYAYNAMVYLTCFYLEILVIFVTDNIVDLILNSMAIFFVAELDDYLVSYDCFTYMAVYMTKEKNDRETIRQLNNSSAGNDNRIEIKIDEPKPTMFSSQNYGAMISKKEYTKVKNYDEKSVKDTQRLLSKIEYKNKCFAVYGLVNYFLWWLTKIIAFGAAIWIFVCY